VPALSEFGGYHINSLLATVISERMIFATNCRHTPNRRNFDEHFSGCNGQDNRQGQVKIKRSQPAESAKIAVDFPASRNRDAGAVSWLAEGINQ
jgi:hypothetical protein